MSWPMRAICTDVVPTYTMDPTPITTRSRAIVSSESRFVEKRSTAKAPTVDPRPAADESQPIHSDPTLSTSR